MAKPSQAMLHLQRLGWEWYDSGVVITAQTDAGDFRVFVPLKQLFVHFGEAFPEHQTISAPQTIGGLFGFVKRATRKAKRGLKRLGRATKNLARQAKHSAVRIATHPREALTYAVVPTYAMHSLPGMRSATKFVAHNAPFALAREAAKATLAGQEHLDEFRRHGRINPVKVARDAARLTAQSAQGKAAANRLLQGAPATAAVRRAISTAKRAEDQLSSILARAHSGDRHALAQLAAVRAILAR